jgi:hypothetical protein
MNAAVIPSQSSLLKPATVEQAAAKIGIFGPQGSGKTTTAALIALGLSITYHNRAPVAFMDTENGSDYLVPLFEQEGVPLLNFKSRAFTDMRAGIAEARATGCCVYLIDSYTHPWKELQDSLKKKLRVNELQFRHMDELKSLWQAWTDEMLNSPLHVILSGRLGYVWDKEQNEETGKRDNLVKLGTKMKSENEAGYEPSLLIEMEGLQDAEARQKKTRAKRGTITHHAYVLKDRWRTLNGKTFSWRDMNDYSAGDWEPVFKSFQPHFSKLAIGRTQQAVNGTRTSAELFDNRGASLYQQHVKEVAIALEEIEGTLVTLWPGQDAKSKEMKRVAVEAVFETRSWTAVENKPLAELELGLATVRIFEQTVASGRDADALTDKAAALKLLAASKARALVELDMTPAGEPREVTFEGFGPR